LSAHAPNGVWMAPTPIRGKRLAAVKSKDFLEEIWVRDVADLSWDVFRLRRIKAKFWTSQVAAAIRCTLQDVCGESQANKLSRQWETGVIGRIDQLAATGRTVSQ
jgi:hypothetical protein